MSTSSVSSDFASTIKLESSPYHTPAVSETQLAKGEWSGYLTSSFNKREEQKTKQYYSSPSVFYKFSSDTKTSGKTQTTPAIDNVETQSEPSTLSISTISIPSKVHLNTDTPTDNAHQFESIETLTNPLASKPFNSLLVKSLELEKVSSSSLQVIKRYIAR